MLTKCVKLKDLCKNRKLQTTPHSTIMEQLRNRADRFRKQGRLRDKELEDIISKIKEGEEFKANNVSKTETDEHKRVMEVMGEGLLQMHGTAPNTKQDGIFKIMDESCNGLNNRIGGNDKIGKIMDIKEDLDINCLMICEHHLNFRHKDNKNDLKQMF